MNLLPGDVTLGELGNCTILMISKSNRDDRVKYRLVQSSNNVKVIKIWATREPVGGSWEDEKTGLLLRAKFNHECYDIFELDSMFKQYKQNLLKE